MIILFVEQVIMLHEMLLTATGGSRGIREMGMLESAINSPFATFHGADLYPSIEEKAARFGFGIISNHPFVDGNKRTGLLVMLTFLELNSIELVYTDTELIEVGLGLASGKMSNDQLVEWIREHK